MTAPLHRQPDLPPVTRPEDPPSARESALARWQAQVDALVDPADVVSRDEHLVAERRRSAFDREQDALERWQKQARDEEPSTAPVVALVHRHEWMRPRLADALEARGWRVLDGQDQHAEAVAAVVVHQPQVLLTSDRIAGGTGLELVSRTRELSPSTTVVVQVDLESRARAFAEAGAHVVLSHRASWHELVDAVAELVPSG